VPPTTCALETSTDPHLTFARPSTADFGPAWLRGLVPLSPAKPAMPSARRSQRWFKAPKLCVPFTGRNRRWKPSVRSPVALTGFAQLKRSSFAWRRYQLHQGRLRAAARRELTVPLSDEGSSSGVRYYLPGMGNGVEKRGSNTLKTSKNPRIRRPRPEFTRQAKLTPRQTSGLRHVHRPWLTSLCLNNLARPPVLIRPIAGVRTFRRKSRYQRPFPHRVFIRVVGCHTGGGPV